MDAQMMQAQAAQARLSRTNYWILKISDQLDRAATGGWLYTHAEELLHEPKEVQERVLAYFIEKGYQAYYGTYELKGWSNDSKTIWFSSVPPKVKEPGVISQVVHRLFGGSKDRH